MGKWTSKLTLIIISQTKVIKRYPNNSSEAFRSEDLKGQMNGRSLISLSTPLNDRLRFALRLTRRVAVCIVGGVIHWSSDSFHCSNSIGHNRSQTLALKILETQGPLESVWSGLLMKDQSGHPNFWKAPNYDVHQILFSRNPVLKNSDCVCPLE